MRGGRAGERDDQARVVLELAVAGEQPAAQARRGARRGQRATSARGCGASAAARAPGVRAASAQHVAGASPAA